MKQLIEHPTMREAPSALLERLREIDPNIELVYIGKGYWALGSVQPHSEREKRARETLGFQYSLPEHMRSVGAIRYAKIRMQGFRHIALYTEGDVENGKVLLDFRERDWNYRHRAEEVYRKRIEDADYNSPGNVQRRIEMLLDFHRSEGPSIYRYAFLGRKSVGPSLN